MILWPVAFQARAGATVRDQISRQVTATRMRYSESISRLCRIPYPIAALAPRGARDLNTFVIAGATRWPWSTLQAGIETNVLSPALDEVEVDVFYSGHRQAAAQSTM